MQQHRRIEASAAQHSDQAPQTVRPVVFTTPAERIAIHPGDVGNAGIRHQQFIGARSWLGEQRDRRAEMLGQRVDVRQVPHHVADSR